MHSASHCTERKRAYSRMRIVLSNFTLLQFVPKRSNHVVLHLLKSFLNRTLTQASPGMQDRSFAAICTQRSRAAGPVISCKTHRATQSRFSVHRFLLPTKCMIHFCFWLNITVHGSVWILLLTERWYLIRLDRRDTNQILSESFQLPCLAQCA